MSGGRSERHPDEVARSFLADAACDLEEVRVVREALRQWDRGCFRAQQAAAKSLRALRVSWGDAASGPARSVEEEAIAIGDRAPEIAARLGDARILDRYYLRTGLPLGSPQIHAEADFAFAERTAVELRALVLARWRNEVGPPDGSP